MKKLNKFLIAALLAAGVNTAFAEVQDRHLTGFHAVSEMGAFDVYITQGNTESVRVEAPSDVIDKIITEVNGDVLKIYQKNGRFSWDNIFSGRKKVAVYVTVKSIRAISLSGSGDAYFKDGLTSDHIEVSTSGSGDVLGRLNVKKLEVGGSGSGDVKLSGSAETLSVRLNGSGDFSGRELVTATSMVRLSGSGDATVNVSQKLDASLSGSGDIRYTGGARDVSRHTSGSGDISRF